MNTGRTEIPVPMLPDLAMIALMGVFGVMSILYGASGGSKKRKTSLIVIGVLFLLLAGYLLAAYLHAGPGRALLP